MVPSLPPRHFVLPSWWSRRDKILWPIIRHPPCDTDNISFHRSPWPQLAVDLWGQWMCLGARKNELWSSGSKETIQQWRDDSHQDAAQEIKFNQLHSWMVTLLRKRWSCKIDSEGTLHRTVPYASLKTWRWRHDDLRLKWANSSTAWHLIFRSCMIYGGQTRCHSVKWKKKEKKEESTVILRLRKRTRNRKEKKGPRLQLTLGAQTCISSFRSCEIYGDGKGTDDSSSGWCTIDG